jgi:hypothetical protein
LAFKKNLLKIEKRKMEDFLMIKTENTLQTKICCHKNKKEEKYFNCYYNNYSKQIREIYYCNNIIV